MTLLKKSLALIIACGIGAAAAAEPDSEGWLFLGRRAADGWRPASQSISNPRYPVRAGDRVVVRNDALVYGSVDCKVVDLAEFKAGDPPRPVQRVRADRQGLEVIGAALECPSVGRAKTVWANVRISGARLLGADR
jgi:hypothetical protein